ncbi:MAG: hypothetical protein JSC085_000334 [Candidatus Tokpelaia sp. JSC085]|nr:MAG: hypothetical protein JSC085_000334 [Candidatus Tokpelaia sp. JSC085]
MISIQRLNGVSACHMCGRCAGYRNAVVLKARSCNEEIVEYGAQKNNIWEIRLLLYGMIGVAIGAFTWTINPWFVHFKLILAKWLIEHDIFWPLSNTAPWWILTNYPANNDSLNWIDGFCIIVYILGAGLLFGVFLSVVLSLIATLMRQKLVLKQHLAQALLPIAAMGLFLGLTMTTVKLLQYDMGILWQLNDIRVFFVFVASLWSFYLGIRILSYYQPSVYQWVGNLLLWSLALMPIIVSWLLIFNVL